MQETARLWLKWSASLLEFGEFGWRADFACEVEHLAIEAEQHSVLGPTDARGILQHCLEYRLYLAG